MGSEQFKRRSSLYGGKPEKIVDISHDWKTKNVCNDSQIKQRKSHERIFVSASNVDRQKEEGCMNKLKIERTNKLWNEDFKGRPSYSIINGLDKPKSVWINSFGDQAKLL